jgi:hypothetical protein
MVAVDRIGILINTRHKCKLGAARASERGYQFLEQQVSPGNLPMPAKKKDVHAWLVA